MPQNKFMNAPVEVEVELAIGDLWECAGCRENTREAARCTRAVSIRSDEMSGADICTHWSPWGQIVSSSDLQSEGASP